MSGPSDFQAIRHDRDEGILEVTLHRPDKLNAFTITMADELEQTFREVNHDDDIRAVIVTGAGRAFCAGMDLSTQGNAFGYDDTKSPGLADMQSLDHPDIARVRDAGGRVAMAIYDCRKPVIAAINGAAVGIGATMTLAMDRRVMADSARIGLVFGRIGVVPEATSSFFLPRLVGPSAAIDLVYRADILSAVDAERVKLVDEVTTPEQLLQRARQIADAWTLGRSPVAIALARQMIQRNALVRHPADAHRVESLGMFWTSVGDGREGVAAFLEKRSPDFVSRASHMPEFYEHWIEGSSQP